MGMTRTHEKNASVGPAGRTAPAASSKHSATPQSCACTAASNANRLATSSDAHSSKQSPAPAVT
eukprot:4841706-Lingulodinium_polyedra.AAC.1